MVRAFFEFLHKLLRGDDTDAKLGGTYRMSFMSFGTGRGHSFGGEYLEPMVTAV